MQDARVASRDRAKAASGRGRAAFNSAAERIEGITRKLNQTLGNGVGASGESCCRAGRLRARRSAYIGRAGLRGATEKYSPGPYDPNGSCPWPGSWVRTYGAHLLL